jgi:ACT domain-containing protein
MRAIVTVIGSDRVGIIARVSSTLAQHQINILDIRQTVMQEFFTMIMLVDLAAMALTLDELNSTLAAVGTDLGVSIRVQREDIFKSMHQI